MGVDNRKVSAHADDRRYKSARIFAGKVVENARAKHHVKLPILLSTKIANVVSYKFNILEAESFGGETSMSIVRFPSLDSDDFSTLRGKLQRESTFQATKVKNAKLTPGLSGKISDNLNRSAETTSWAGTFRVRLDPMRQRNAICDPRAEFGNVVLMCPSLRTFGEY